MTARARLLTIAAVTAAVDLTTKAAAVRWLTSPVELPGLTLRVIRNTGVAFGLGADQPFAVVAAVTGLVVAVLAVAAWRGHIGGPVTAGLVVGGGVANITDRLVGGAVVDLFDVGRWPVFNLADVALTVGVAVLLLASVSEADEPDTASESAPTSSGAGRG